MPRPITSSLDQIYISGLGFSKCWLLCHGILRSSFETGIPFGRGLLKAIFKLLGQNAAAVGFFHSHLAVMASTRYLDSTMNAARSHGADMWYRLALASLEVCSAVPSSDGKWAAPLGLHCPVTLIKWSSSERKVACPQQVLHNCLWHRWAHTQTHCKMHTLCKWMC